MTTLLIALGYLTFVAVFFAAIALNVGERSARRRDREEARAAAHERLARHQTRPFVDIDVQLRRGP